MNVYAPPPEGRSLLELLADLSHESSDLLRKEVELAKVGITESLSKLQSALIEMAVAGGLVFAGLLALVAAAVLALDESLHQPWLSSFVVGAGVVLLGLIALLSARRRAQGVDVPPQRSVESLREDGEMLQRHMGAKSH